MLLAFWITVWACLYLAVGCLVAGLSASKTRDATRETLVMFFWGPALVVTLVAMLLTGLAYPFGKVTDQIAAARGCREVPDQEAGE